jgi:HlyD family secretion protein
LKSNLRIKKLTVIENKNFKEYSMNQKSEIKVKRPPQKTTIVIWVLIGIILLIAAAGVVQYLNLQKQAQKIKDEAAASQTETTVVKKGNLTEKLDDISGTVRPNQSVYLYWQTSGTVSDVNVQLGDNVKKGDVLAALDRSTIDTSIIEAEVTKEEAEEDLERLYTSSFDLATAMSNVATTKKAVQDAQDALDALGVVREDEVEIGVYYNDYLEAKENYQKALDNFETMRDRALDDVDRQRAVQMVEGARSRMESALSMYNWYNGEVDALEKQQAEAALLLAQAQYEDAVRSYEKIKNGPTESQIASLQAQIKAAEATMKTAYIVAPIDGTVVEVGAKQFDVIAYESTSTSRDILAARVDDLSSYFIDITVNELDINQISIGQKVTISFDAIPLKEYTGTITNISNVGEVSDSTVTFSLTVKMDRVDNKVKAGMMADVAIVTKEAVDVLYVPSTSVSMKEDGTRFVSKKNADGTFTDIPVQLGMVSGSDTQIISDQIQEGDEIINHKMPLNVNVGLTIGGVTFGGGPGVPGGGPGGAGGPPTGAGAGGGRPQ